MSNQTSTALDSIPRQKNRPDAPLPSSLESRRSQETGGTKQGTDKSSNPTRLYIDTAS